MAFRRKRTYKKRAPKRRFAKRRGAKRPALKRLVRREMTRNMETKSIQQYNLDRTLRTPGDPFFDDNNVFALGPDPSTMLILQGTGNASRIGNRIRTKKLTIKGVFTPTGYDGVYNPGPTPMQIKMYVFYDKYDPTAVPRPDASGDFFDNGNGTRTFARDVTDMMMPVNTDRYRILTTRKFKLGFQQYTGSGNNPPNGNYSNNDFKLNCNFSLDLTKYYPKNVRFMDNSSLPTTRSLYCMVEAVTCSGSATQTFIRGVQMQYVQEYKYTDA